MCAHAFLLPIASLLFISGCNLNSSAKNTLIALDHLLQAPAAGNNVNVKFCTDPAVPEKFVVKTLIILDHSGSNKQNYKMAPDNSGAPLIINNTIDISTNYATDPNGHLRYGDLITPGTLLNYLSTTPANNPADPLKYFALVDFSTGASTYPAGSSGFTSDIPAFYNHIQNEANSFVAGGSPDDTGSTSYIAALTAGYNTINNDILTAVGCAALATTSPPTSTCPHPGVQIASSYVIVFMSDGSPITDISGIGVNGSGNIVVTGVITVTRESTNQILGAVKTMVGLTANTKYVAGVNLFTIYYYNPTNNIDGAGQSLLSQMAKTGNGLAYNAISGSKIDYTRFVPPVKTIKYLLSDIFVTNSSVVWWNDGTQRLDSDGDGIPDDVEIAWGSDPFAADSNGNGVSDFVKYQLSGGAPCVLKNGLGRCIDAPVNYALGACAGIASGIVNGKTVFTSSDPNGLNDCEKLLLSDVGGIKNPDSNGDSIPDWLEFKNGVAFQLGTPSAFTSSNADGFTNYQKIKLSLPTRYPLNEILNLNPSNYSLQLRSTDANQDCYNLTVSNLPKIGLNNKIQVDVIEKSSLLQDRFLYRTGTKTYSGDTTLNFNDWNDPVEKAAGTWSMWP